MKPIGFFALIAGLFLLIAACGGGGDEPTPSQQLSVAASEGQRLFTANACSACHGSAAQGTSIAPGLGPHYRPSEASGPGAFGGNAGVPAVTDLQR